MQFVSRYIGILQNIEKRWTHFDTLPMPTYEEDFSDLKIKRDVLEEEVDFIHWHHSDDQGS